MGRKQSEYRKGGKRRGGGPPSSYTEDAGGFAVAEMIDKVRSEKKGEKGEEAPLSKEAKQMEEKIHEVRERKEKERQIQASQRGGRDHQKGGNRMYIRPEDVRSDALKRAAEKMVEAKPKGEGSEEYKNAKLEFDKALNIQRIKSPRNFEIKETLRTAHDLQRDVVLGKINRDVLFLVAEAINKRHLGYIAVAINNVRNALLDKEVDLQKAGVTDRADPQNIQRFLALLGASDLGDKRGYLASKVPYKLLQKMEARIARELILAQNPGLADQLPELPFDRKVELTKEDVQKILGGLQSIGNSSQYRILTDVVHESWRRPILPKKKVEESSETPETAKEKAESTKEEAKKAPKVEKVEKVEADVVKDVELNSLTLKKTVKDGLKAAGLDTARKIVDKGEKGLILVKGIGEKTAPQVVEVANKALKNAEA